MLAVLRLGVLLAERQLDVGLLGLRADLVEVAGERLLAAARGTRDEQRPRLLRPGLQLLLGLLDLRVRPDDLDVRRGDELLQLVATHVVLVLFGGALGRRLRLALRGTQARRQVAVERVVGGGPLLQQPPQALLGQLEQPDVGVGDQAVATARAAQQVPLAEAGARAEPRHEVLGPRLVDRRHPDLPLVDEQHGSATGCPCAGSPPPLG